MFGFTKKISIRLLTSIVNYSNHTECISVNNQQCMFHDLATLINLNHNEYGQGLCYYPFTVNLDRQFGSCNTLNDVSNRLCVPNKTEDLNLIFFNTIAVINESKSLTKHISCKR